jgi:pentatricopeptide repeat protein
MCISMISTCVTASQLGEADLWLQRIRTMHQSASMFAYETYTTALTALWRREHSPVLLQRVLSLLDEVRADTRLQASRVLLTNALSAAAKSRDGPAAVRIVALFDSLQYPRDAILLASFLEVYVRTKRIDDAAALFQEMKADKKVSAAAYKMMVGLYADVRQLDRAREVFEEAKSVDMATKATYREIIGACMRCGNAELARTYEEEERANAHRLK